MIRIMLAVATAGALALFGGRASAQTPYTPQTMPKATTHEQEPDHVAEATRETQAAIDAGSSGQTDQVVQHAQQALTHAQAAERDRPDPKLEAAIKSLQEAVKQGQSGKVELAMKAAQAALQKLQG